MTVGGTVLIACAERARSKQIQEACAARGFATRLAGDGAATLETALAEAPEVVVVARDLGLIDPDTLAGILHANPRTRNVRFVLLQGQPALPTGAVWDATVAADASPSEVVAEVERVLADRARIDAVGRAAERDLEVQGDLAQIGLCDLVQLLNLNGKTGTLELVRQREDGEERGQIHLIDGELVQAALGTVDGEKAFFRMLSWKRGRFAFGPAAAAVPRRIGMPTRTLLMEGMRQQDEWERSRQALPSQDAQVALKVPRSELPRAAHALTQEVLLLLEVHGRVGDIVDRCSFPDYQVLRTLETLGERGLIQLRDGPTRRAEPGAGVFAAAQLRRLRDWCERRGGTDVDHSAKILVVASGPEAIRDFVRVLRGLPGLRLEGGFAAGRAVADDLVSIGRLRLDADLAVDLIHVPRDPAYAAIWPLAAHDALGALFLLSTPVTRSLEAVQEAADAFGSMARTRVVHAVLADKEAGLAGDAVLEELAPRVTGPTGLLPLEDTREARAVLQRLLAETVP